MQQLTKPPDLYWTMATLESSFVISDKVYPEVREYLKEKLEEKNYHTHTNSYHGGDSQEMIQSFCHFVDMVAIEHHTQAEYEKEREHLKDNVHAWIGNRLENANEFDYDDPIPHHIYYIVRLSDSHACILAVIVGKEMCSQTRTEFHNFFIQQKEQ